MKLKDICKFVNEKVDTSSFHLEDYVSTENLLPNKGGVTVASKIPQGKATLFKKGDILISNIRPYFKKIYLAKKQGCCSNDVLCIRPNSNIPSSYLYYLLSQDSFFDYVMTGAKGTKMPRGDKGHIMNWPVYQSTLSQQQNIAEILTPLDDKIAVNSRICANLEAQAQALFKSWFVDFTPFKDQPFVDSELGPIPQGWKVGTLGEFFPIVTGKKDANISSKSGKYPFFSCSQNISWTNDYSFDGFAIIVAGNGDFNVKWYNGKFEAYQRTYVLIPYNPTLTSWLYYAVKYNLNMITIGARGSVIKFITKGDIQNFKVAYPQNIDKHEIVKMLGKINKDIEHNKNEVSCLAKLRDTLLPKLMSGEIKL